MFDPLDSETVPELFVSRDAPLTVGTNAISVYQENVSGATGSTESGEAAYGPNTEDSSTRIMSAAQISVTPWTIAKKSMDPGLLFSRSLSDEEKKLAERD